MTLQSKDQDLAIEASTLRECRDTWREKGEKAFEKYQITKTRIGFLVESFELNVIDEPTFIRLLKEMAS